MAGFVRRQELRNRQLMLGVARSSIAELGSTETEYQVVREAVREASVSNSESEITGVPISALPVANAPDTSDVVPGVQSGTTKKFSLSSLLGWIKENSLAVSGILKGDGAGGVSAAVAGTDYGTYSKPSGGIPASDLASAVQTSLGKADTAYQKPSAGIPSSDMASAVQTSLGKADTAYQKPSSGIPASDIASGVIPTVPSISTSTPTMDGTGAAGNTGEVSDAGHTHPSDTSKCRQMTIAVPAGKSVDVNVLGTNYAPNYSFILSATGNSSTVNAVWLCYGFGTRTTNSAFFHLFPLFSSGGSALALGSTTNGKITLTNNSSQYGCGITIAVLQEADGSLELSAPY